MVYIFVKSKYIPLQIMKNKQDKNQIYDQTKNKTTDQSNQKLLLVEIVELVFRLTNYTIKNHRFGIFPG